MRCRALFHLFKINSVQPSYFFKVGLCMYVRLLQIQKKFECTSDDAGADVWGAA